MIDTPAIDHTDLLTFAVDKSEDNHPIAVELRTHAVNIETLEAIAMYALSLARDRLDPKHCPACAVSYELCSLALRVFGAISVLVDAELNEVAPEGSVKH